MKIKFQRKLKIKKKKGKKKISLSFIGKKKVNCHLLEMEWLKDKSKDFKESTAIWESN